MAAFFSARSTSGLSVGGFSAAGLHQPSVWSGAAPCRCKYRVRQDDDESLSAGRLVLLASQKPLTPVQRFEPTAPASRLARCHPSMQASSIKPGTRCFGNLAPAVSDRT